MASRNRSLDADRDAGRPDDARADRRHASIEPEVERVFDATRKEHHWGHRNLARDR